MVKQVVPLTLVQMKMHFVATKLVESLFGHRINLKKVSVVRTEQHFGIECSPVWELHSKLMMFLVEPKMKILLNKKFE